MQIILVSRHLKAARTITIMPRHLMIAGFVFLALIVGTSAMLSWLAVQLRVSDGDEAASLQQSGRAQQHLSNNLQLMHDTPVSAQRQTP